MLTIRELFASVSSVEGEPGGGGESPARKRKRPYPVSDDLSTEERYESSSAFSRWDVFSL